jgi:hypothetical protein
MVQIEIGEDLLDLCPLFLLLQRHFISRFHLTPLFEVISKLILLEVLAWYFLFLNPFQRALLTFDINWQ